MIRLAMFLIGLYIRVLIGAKVLFWGTMTLLLLLGII